MAIEMGRIGCNRVDDSLRMNCEPFKFCPLDLQLLLWLLNTLDHWAIEPL